MPLDAQIPLSVQTPQPIDPIAQYGRVVQLQNALQGQQLQQAQLTGLGQENQMRQTQMDIMHATNDSYRQSLNPDGTVDMARLTSALAANGAGTQIAPALKAHTEYQQSLATLAETQGKVAAQQRDAAGLLGLSSRNAGDDPRMLLLGMQQAIQTKAVQNPQLLAPTIQQLQQAFLQDPTGASAKAIAKTWNDSAIGGSQAAQTLLNQQLSGQGRKELGDAAVANSNRLGQANDLKSAISSLITAPPKSSDEYDARTKQLPKGIADQILATVPVNQYDPAKSPDAIARLGMSPDQIVSDMRTKANQAAEQAFRAQQLSIEQQNAGTSAGRLTQEKFAQAQRDYETNASAEEKFAGIKANLQSALQDGQTYINQNGQQVRFDAMKTQSGDPLQASDIAALQQEMRSRVASAQSQIENAVTNKNNALQRSGQQPLISTQDAIAAYRKGGGGQAGPPTPQQPAAAAPAAPRPAGPTQGGTPGDPIIKVQDDKGQWVQGKRSAIAAYLATKGVQLK